MNNKFNPYDLDNIADIDKFIEIYEENKFKIKVNNGNGKLKVNKGILKSNKEIMNSEDEE